MGNLNALPALDVKPPAAPPNPLEEFARVAQIQSQQQNQQAQAQEMQIRQQQINDQQATTKAMQNWDPSTGDYDGLAKAVLQNGGSATAASAIQQHGIQVKTALSTLDKDSLASYQTRQKAMGDQLEGLVDPKVVPDEQLQGRALSTVSGLIQKKIVDPVHGQALQQQIQATNDPTQLRTMIDQFAKATMGASAVAAQQGTQAKTAEDTAKAREENANATMKEIEAKGFTGITPDYIMQTAQDPVTRGQALAALGRGDVQGAKDALKSGFESALGVQKDVAESTNPAIQNAKVALAARTKLAEQTITQGDPAAAGKLLADGSLTLSELKSRGTTPQFIVAATNAAQSANPGFNPQKAEADLGVAKSPANLAFFGSAKSLTDPGGTLDQLKAAAKDIPQNQIPIFNSVADAIKASTGSGPIAKYAALTLGVADDYSKVMGGGQGSDTSRSQAINLISAKQSPEQRDASIEGIRGAVGSQTNSRIGNNPVLHRMYGNAVQPNQTQQTMGHKVGDIIVQNGHQFKASKVDANGKVLAADPQ